MRPGMGEVEKLSRPHLVLPDIRNDNGVPFRDFPQFLHNILRADLIAVPVAERVLVFPGIDGPEPVLRLEGVDEFQE